MKRGNQKGYDHHAPDPAKGQFTVHFRRGDEKLQAHHAEILGALEFVIEQEGNAEAYTEKVTQGRTILWARKEG